MLYTDNKERDQPAGTLRADQNLHHPYKAKKLCVPYPAYLGQIFLLIDLQDFFLDLELGE